MKMTVPTRLARLGQFLRRPVSSASFPLMTIMTIMKIKAFSLFGGTVYLLAMERTGQWRRDGRPNLGLLIRESIEEAKDRWKGFTETCMYFCWGREVEEGKG
jgi:hypothetical protein